MYSDKSEERGDKCNNCGRLILHNQNGKLSYTNCGAVFSSDGRKEICSKM